MGYGELIRVLADEAAREALAVRERALAERERILGEARQATAAAAGALVARERQDQEARRRGALADAALARERAVLQERRRLVDELRGEAARALQAETGDEAALARLTGELLAAVPEGPFELVVDPGAEAAAVAALAAGHPEVLPRATVRTAPASRGGAELRQGRLVFDNTYPARLERAWGALEPELARLLFEEG